MEHDYGHIRMSKTALIAVDMQNDFVSGSLAVRGAKEIFPVLDVLAREVDFVATSRDWHPDDHCSFAEKPEFRDGSWPPHCVQNTWGAEFAWTPPLGVDISLGALKGYDRLHEQYSMFANDWVAAGLDALGVEDVIVGGLALDFCVRETALDAAHRGFGVTVPTYATRWVTSDGMVAACLDLEENGVEVIS